jgi:hypothetical protein
MKDGTKAVHAIKIDNCNARMLAGPQFVRDVKSCYEYGLPPVRMKTTSKLPTSWKRDAGLLTYHDENDIKCVSLVYIDYDNPDLILMDMSTYLDAKIDADYHARASRGKGIQPLRTHFREKPSSAWRGLGGASHNFSRISNRATVFRGGLRISKKS